MKIVSSTTNSATDAHENIEMHIKYTIRKYKDYVYGSTWKN